MTWGLGRGVPCPRETFFPFFRKIQKIREEMSHREVPRQGRAVQPGIPEGNSERGQCAGTQRGVKDLWEGLILQVSAMPVCQASSALPVPLSPSPLSKNVLEE